MTNSGVREVVYASKIHLHAALRLCGKVVTYTIKTIPSVGTAH